MIRIAVLGASGYAARELLRLLLAHPRGRKSPRWRRGRKASRTLATCTRACAAGSTCGWKTCRHRQIAERADCVFSCLPHAASAEAVMPLLAAGCRVVDFSADYRLNDAAVYASGTSTSIPIRSGWPRLCTACPSCTASAFATPSWWPIPAATPPRPSCRWPPLLQYGMISPDGIIIDSKSGVSGGGRTPKPNFHFPEANENFSAYGVGEHRHTPEIDQVLSDAGGGATNVIFTPHLVPMDRGILTTAYSTPACATSTRQAVMKLLRECYANGAVRARRRRPADDQGRGRHELLRHHRPRGPRAGRHDQRARQPDQRRRRRCGAEFQLDVWIRGNDGADVVSCP